MLLSRATANRLRFAFKANPWVNRQPFRCYKRVHVVTPHLDGKKAWIEHVWSKFYPDVSPISPKQLDSSVDKLGLLEDFGCKAYQMLECPEIAFFHEELLTSAMSKLEDISVEAFSLPLINLARELDGEELKFAVNTFVADINGAKSKADFWLKALQCTEEDIYTILQRTPRLLLITDLDTALEKLEVMEKIAEYEAKESDSRALKSSLYLVVNLNLDDMKSRLEQVESGKKNKKTPLSWLRYSKEELSTLIELDNDYEEDRQWLSKMFNKRDFDELLSSQLRFEQQSVSSLKRKVNYVLSLGYSAHDIASNPSIVGHSVSRLENSLKELHELGLDSPSLGVLNNYANRHRVPSRGKQGKGQHLGKALQCSLDELGKLPQSTLNALALQEEDVILQNVAFLRDCGFTLEDLRMFPVVVGHDHSVLCHHWELVASKMDRCEMKQDKWKLLNLLQYSIEKHYNFRWPVVLHSKHDEFDGVENEMLCA